MRKQNTFDNCKPHTPSHSDTHTRGTHTHSVNLALNKQWNWKFKTLIFCLEGICKFQSDIEVMQVITLSARMHDRFYAYLACNWSQQGEKGRDKKRVRERERDLDSLTVAKSSRAWKTSSWKLTLLILPFAFYYVFIMLTMREESSGVECVCVRVVCVCLCAAPTYASVHSCVAVAVWIVRTALAEDTHTHTNIFIFTYIRCAQVYSNSYKTQSYIQFSLPCCEK